jgi:hypothetical protein
MCDVENSLVLVGRIMDIKCSSFFVSGARDSVDDSTEYRVPTPDSRDRSPRYRTTEGRLESTGAIRETMTSAPPTDHRSIVRCLQHSVHLIPTFCSS